MHSVLPLNQAESNDKLMDFRVYLVQDPIESEFQNYVLTVSTLTVSTLRSFHTFLPHGNK